MSDSIKFVVVPLHFLALQVYT